jgi:uncharacterized metal-binding protein YceD (DUF177 family)
MIKIYIQGKEDGEEQISIEVPSEQIEELSQEFFGNILVEGKLKIIGSRYAFEGRVECMAKMICDISLEEFEANISKELSLSYLADTMLYELARDNDGQNDETGENYLHEDQKEIDITEILKDELQLSLPMKRVAPGYEGKSFEEVHPEYTDAQPEEDEEVNAAWKEKLKKLKLN